MKADIITIGDEILIGQIIDTNSAWLANSLEINGIQVNQIISISDTSEHISNTLDNSINSRVDFVFITGGLGPTNDDITKKTLCDFFDDHLVENKEVLNHITRFFEKRGRRINSLTKNQALIPSKCQVLFNEYGTAPAMWFNHDDCAVVSMPGVPSEMKSIMESSVIPKIRSNYVLNEIIHKTIFFRGIVESHLAELIFDWENKLPKEIKLAYLPSVGCLKLRFTARGRDRNYLKNLIDENISSLTEIAGKYFSEYQTKKNEEILNYLLKKHNLTISTAESCTGGNIAKMITSVAGSSSIFKGSIVAYNEDVKSDILGINQSLIKKYGVVSEEITTQMALMSLNTFGTDFAIATSGIAGPSGGTLEKPVGTICYSIVSKKEIFSFTKKYDGDRQTNISRVTDDCFRFLISEIENKSNLV
ncbi:MAG: CinA family nicotinamide mononucleotide deamidase-related protein [Flavobacteriales bacterium]